MDFDHATDADRARAKALAEAAGWRQQGFRYVHPTRGNYLTKDMDGWIDLCDNEGIDWVAPSDAVNASAEARLREAILISIDMIEGCHDAPKNPDSLPEMVKVHLQQALSAGGDEAKKSAPDFSATHNHGESDPQVTADWAGADTDPTADRREIVARLADELAAIAYRGPNNGDSLALFCAASDLRRAALGGR